MPVRQKDDTGPAAPEPPTTRPPTRNTPVYPPIPPTVSPRPPGMAVSSELQPPLPVLQPRKRGRPSLASKQAEAQARAALLAQQQQQQQQRPSSDLVAPEITYYVPPASTTTRTSSLVRPPAQPPTPTTKRQPPAVVTPVPPPSVPTSPAQLKQQQRQPPPRTDRNIDKVVLGDLCFRTWYPSYYGKELLGVAGAVDEAAAPSSGAASKNNHNHSQQGQGHGGGPVLERLYVCPSCFKYSKELVAWWGHVRVCHRKGQVPGRKIYVHPLSGDKPKAQQQGGKRKRGGAGGEAPSTEETVEDKGEWSIWEVDGEQERLYCQNLSLFAKLFLDNKSVFFDVGAFNYYLLAYRPGHTQLSDGSRDPTAEAPRSQVVGFFSKEKMSWDNNNLACILVFPPWQRRGLGALLMGASYELSRRDGVVGGPEKPISDLGRRGYRRYWAAEVARWLLSLRPGVDIVDVSDCSAATYIAVEDCLAVLRDMNIVCDAGIGPGKPPPTKSTDGSGADEDDAAEDGSQDMPDDVEQDVPQVPRVKVDKEAVRKYVASQKLSLERVCDPAGFME